MMPKRFVLTIGQIIWLAILLVACNPAVTIHEDASPGTPFFRPSTPEHTLPTATAGSLVSAPTPTVTCIDQLTFLSDVTIPDGSVVSPNSTLDKRWAVENSGNCNWNVNYRIRRIAGPDLGAQEEQALYPARSGSRAVIRLVFKAPQETGSYRSAWQAYNPAGEPFGDAFFIDIIVQ